MQTTFWISSARHLLVAMVLVFFCTAAVAMQISVETGSGASITLEVESSDSIQQVKHMIQDSTGIDPQKQQLYFGAVLLEDGRTLGDYAVQPGDVLRLAVLMPVMVPIAPSAGLIGLGLLLILSAMSVLARKRI